MRSSASTPSRPDRPLPLWLALVGDDHPRACTGRRLLRGGLVRPWPPYDRRTGPVVLLDPFSTSPLSRRELPQAQEAGLLVVDCSWNSLSSSSRLPPVPGLGPRGGLRRRLPFLFAANPQHYGRLGELNTVEALAAALLVLGEERQADQLLASTAGGDALRTVNEERFALYAAANDADEVKAAERELFDPRSYGRRRSAPRVRSSL